MIKICINCGITNLERSFKGKSCRSCIRKIKNSNISPKYCKYCDKLKTCKFDAAKCYDCRSKDNKIKREKFKTSKEEFKCNFCNKIGFSSEFYNKYECKKCRSSLYKEYRKNNKEKEQLRHKIYNENNKEIIKIKRKIYRNININLIKEQNQKNNKKFRENLNNKKNRNLKEKEKRKNPTYRLRQNISRNVRYFLGIGSKNGKSILNYLPYTMEKLKDHIESLFSHPDNLTPDGKVWMNWDNQGKYSPKYWNDNDPNTWKWNLEHIIPHSKFQYTSMEDQGFKKCWSLDNLRPYCAKKNVQEQNNRTEEEIAEIKYRLFGIKKEIK